MLNSKNKLKGMRVYLCGSMDRVSDGGVTWRNWITPQLQQSNLVVINPCDKPIDLGNESMENRKYRQSLIDNGQYDEMAKQMKTIRAVDLRLVDLSDFLIVNFDTDAYMCGTAEEVALANRQKKPVLLYCPRGVKNLYHWMWGMLPHQHFFDKWEDLFSYLNKIDSGEDTNHLKRWTWFDYDKLNLSTVRPENEGSVEDQLEKWNKAI